MKLVNIVGARPQFIKLAPILKAIEQLNREQPDGKIQEILVHTGQHYDYQMSGVFFDELGLKEPNHHLGVGSGTHGQQTGDMLKGIEAVLLKEKPDWVLVYGDTNSTLAGALAAAKLHMPVAHIEAGLRSFNRRMPEELNRVVTDHVSDMLFCPTENAVENLRREGFTNILNEGKLLPPDYGLRTTDAALSATDHRSNQELLSPTDPTNPTNSMNRVKLDNSIECSSLTRHMPLVVNVGDVMYDAVLLYSALAEERSDVLSRLRLKPGEYALATVHRAENTDDPLRLRGIFDGLEQLAASGLRVVAPLHPRTRKALAALSLGPGASLISGFTAIDPVSYLDMLVLEKNARVILTDSGGVQKEAFFFHVPCVTLREETEWVETVESGWNTLVQPCVERILQAASMAGALCDLRERSMEKSGVLADPYGRGNATTSCVQLLSALRSGRHRDDLRDACGFRG